MENSILSALRWNPDAGALTFHDVRYLLIRPETLAAFQRAVEADVRASETLCAARGDATCRMEVEGVS